MDRIRITHEEDDDGPARWEPLSDSEDDDHWVTDSEDEEEVASTSFYTSMDRIRITHEEDDDGPARWEPLSDSEDEEEVASTIPPLLSVPSTLVKPNDSLCGVCRALGLTPRHFVVLPGDGVTGDEVEDPNIRLGYVDDIQRKSYCPLCRLVLRALGPALPAYEDGERVELAMAWSTDGPRNDYGRTPQIRVLKPYAQKEGGDFLLLSTGRRLHLYPEITILANDAQISSKSLFPRLIADSIDFSMVRNWLSMCEDAHGYKCDISTMVGEKVEDPATKIPSFRVIDVIENCITLAPENCKYVVLSYVWGLIDPKTILRTLKANVSDLQKPGGLLRPKYYKNMPQTVRDAMEVVRRVELRYLWVDSLCIIQDDDEKGGSKLDAISKMDLVYGAAFLMIMVASGKDARAGIAGLYPGTRGDTQPIEEIGPDFRLAYKQKFQDYIASEVYFTRGWTYQELRFSNRQLIFIGGQVVFRCKGVDQWREDVVCEDGRLDDRSNPTKERDPDDIGQYEGLIQWYSKLSLGYQSDVHHAFAGMAHYLNTKLGVNLCHGIPDSFFDWFLLWTSHAPQKRRLRDKTTLACAPSWSWAGWTGEAWPHIWDWYNRSIKNVRKALGKRTWIIWYQRKAHNSEECALVWTSGYSPSGNRNFYGQRAKNRFPFDCSKTRPTPCKLIGAPEYYADSNNPNPGSGFLQFWTVSAKFKLDKPRPPKLTSDDFGPPIPGLGTSGPKNTRTRVGIYGRNGREVGVVFVNPDWERANVPKVHEFILICEGRDERARGGRFDEEDGWKYQMMLVEWKGAWAERIGMGSIEKVDLSQALGTGPVWKEIILG